VGNVLVFYPDGKALLWDDVVSAAELGGGLLCFLSPPSVRRAADRGVRPGDELLLRRLGKEYRVRVELVRQAEDGPDWACFVVRGCPGPVA
jgi:hypothetical protein